jgi:glycosyltransferase involved in cell wall biosynthesis
LENEKILLDIEPNQTILIKTYLHESGLFYLAKSLGDLLKKAGHKVIYMPKSKYLLRGSLFNRTYLKANDEDLLNGEIVHLCDERKSIESQVINASVKYNATVLISFETLMEKSHWIYKVKHITGMKIIDVPMIEWVSENLLNGKSYVLFDEIWCLTDQCYEYFNKYSKAKRISWDYIDHDLFSTVQKEEGVVRFYHAGSLNDEYSTKNTDLVIKAFERFSEKNPNSELIVSGLIKDRETLNIVKKHNNIIVIDGVLKREDMIDIYKKSHCVVIPSSREGLGMSLYEASACGSLVITTNCPPMNEFNTKYLCNTSGIKRDRSLVPLNILSVDSIYDQMINVYGDIVCQK